MPHIVMADEDGTAGSLDRVEGDRIKLTKKDGAEGSHRACHFIDMGLVAKVEGDKVRLSANAVTMEEEGRNRWGLSLQMPEEVVSAHLVLLSASSARPSD
jgi:hypothetical protein